ncbi:MAG TPA: response regulator [Bryobacteraceae bacterium]|nr:response regulator [Bryobacteraceae bacterium]
MDRQDEDGKLITSILEKAGFHVLHSSTGAGAVELCRAADEAVQLVILDAATPGIQASRLLARLREIDPEIRVLLIAEGESAGWALPANVKARLHRPFRRAQLLGSVLEAARRPLTRTA